MGLGQVAVVRRGTRCGAPMFDGLGLVRLRIEGLAVDFCLILAEFGGDPDAAISGQYEMRLADGIYSGCWNLMDV